MLAAINPMQLIATTGAANFVANVQTGMIGADQAREVFGTIDQALDRYVGSAPSRDYPRELHSMIEGLPEGNISSDLCGRVLSLIEADHAVVDKAVRIHAINEEAPFDLPAEWRWIPAGEFRMGSAGDDPHRYDDEKVLETVMTGGFFMLDHPVTNAEFRAFLKATGREDLRDLVRKFAGDLQPAVRVTHEEATAYSKWLGEKIAESMGIPVIGRLPFEEEWEKAAKGPGENEFISPATSEQAHFNKGVTRAVDHSGVYANGYGLMDMIGNVWEWMLSPWEGSSNFALRGACWHFHNPRVLRAAYLHNDDPGNRFYNIGFRPVLVLQD